MSKGKTFKKGDKVSWNTSQGETQGKVVKKVTSDIKIKSQKITASKEDPKYLVKSDKTEKQAAHKPESLEKN
ncbi:MAG: DUF2945 domain-containing protein [Pseudomonadota bacterium]